MNVIVAEYANDVPVGQAVIVVDSRAGGATVVGGQVLVTVGQGVQGPQGPAGGAPAPVVVTLTDAPEWSYPHTFPYDPDVAFIDSQARRVYAGVDYPNGGTVHALFPTPFTGKVILR